MVSGGMVSGTRRNPLILQPLRPVKSRGYGEFLTPFPLTPFFLTLDLRIPNAMRSLRLLAEALAAIPLIVRVVAFEERHTAIPFERQDMSRNAIEKPPVVTNDDRTAGKIEQRLLERS